MEKQAESSRYALIDSLYVLGMLLVVLGHTNLGSSSEEPLVMRWLRIFRMPLFFWIAGFLSKKDEPFLVFLKKKSERLLVPLAVLTGIVYAGKFLLASFANRPPSGLGGYFIAFVYPFQNPIIILWFLNVLFAIHLIGWFIRKWGKGNVWFYLLVAFIFIGLSLYLPKTEFLGISDICYFFPYFLFGYICKIKKDLLDSQYIKSPVSALLLLCLFIGMAYWNIGRYPTAFIGILMCLSTVSFLQSRSIAVFPALRPYTFTIYLLQWFPMVAIQSFCFNRWAWNPYLCLALMFVCGVGIPALAGWLTDRIFPARGFGYFVRLCLGRRV